MSEIRDSLEIQDAPSNNFVGLYLHN